MKRYRKAQAFRKTRSNRENEYSGLYDTPFGAISEQTGWRRKTWMHLKGLMEGHNQLSTDVVKKVKKYDE